MNRMLSLVPIHILNSFHVHFTMTSLIYVNSFRRLTSLTLCKHGKPKVDLLGLYYGVCIFMLEGVSGVSLMMNALQLLEKG